MADVADMRDCGQPDLWLETELAAQLCPVSAPDSLWCRIYEQRRPLRVQSRPWTAWSIAAAALLMLLAGLVWRLGATRDPAANLEVLAERELRDTANGSGKFDIRSGDPGEIQRWVKAKLDVDIRLADHPTPGNGAVRLLGARIIWFQGFSVAAVTYRVDGDLAAMLVADKHAGFTGLARNGLPRTRLTAGIRSYSWSLGAAEYAIAFANTNQPQRPCLLCHTNAPALMVLR
jgi:hypothetical protein